MNEVTIHVKAKDDASAKMGAIDKASRKLAVGAGVAAAAIGGVLVKAIGDSIAEAREAQKVHNQTVAVLKSTHHAAGMTAKSVEALAERISNMTGIDDEAIQAGENMLLTFTNVRNEFEKGNFTFHEATQVMTDMSVALGQDLTTSAMQLGKALNDPVRGMTALRRVGVSFTKEQEKSIKTMVKHGDIAGAQAVILKELKKEFGGSAEAAATWGDKAKVAGDNIKEAFGKKLLPALEKVSKWFTEEGADALGEFTDSFDAQKIDDAASSVILIAESIGKVSKALGRWDKVNGRAFTTFGVNLGIAGDAFKFWKAHLLSGLDSIAQAGAKLGIFPKKVAASIHAMRVKADEELHQVLVKVKKTADDTARTKIEAKIKADKKDLEAKVRDAKRRLKETNDQKTKADIRAEISQLRAQVAAAKRALASVHDRTVTITAFYRSSGTGPTSAGRRASGGYVGGTEGHAAEGGARGGRILVGEQGPEIVDLPHGSHVNSNADSRRLMSGGGGGDTYITVNAPNYVGAPSDLIRALVDAKRRGQLDVVFR